MIAHSREGDRGGMVMNHVALRSLKWFQRAGGCCGGKSDMLDSDHGDGGGAWACCTIGGTFEDVEKYSNHYI
jgi:hypothetical protein